MLENFVLDLISFFKVQGWNSYVAFVNDFNSEQEKTHDYDVFNKGSESQSWEILA